MRRSISNMRRAAFLQIPAARRISATQDSVQTCPTLPFIMASSSPPPPPPPGQSVQPSPSTCEGADIDIAPVAVPIRRDLKDKYFCIADPCKEGNGGNPRREHSGGRNHKCTICHSWLRVKCRYCACLFSKGPGQKNHMRRKCLARKTVLVYVFGAYFFLNFSCLYACLIV